MTVGDKYFGDGGAELEVDIELDGSLENQYNSRNGVDAMYNDGRSEAVKRERNGSRKQSSIDLGAGGEYDSGAEPSTFSKRSRPGTGATGPREDHDGDGVESEDEGDGDGARVYASPAGLILQRDALSPAAIASEIEGIHGMWEMASVLDFMHLFRKQLKLQRQFAAEELERVMVTSPGDGGLLADVHIVSNYILL